MLFILGENTFVNQSGIVNLYETNTFNTVFVQNELLSHADVSAKNLKAIKARKQCILNELIGTSGRLQYAKHRKNQTMN